MRVEAEVLETDSEHDALRVLRGSKWPVQGVNRTLWYAGLNLPIDGRSKTKLAITWPTGRMQILIVEMRGGSIPTDPLLSTVRDGISELTLEIERLEKQIEDGHHRQDLILKKARHEVHRDNLFKILGVLTYRP